MRFNFIVMVRRYEFPFVMPVRKPAKTLIFLDNGGGDCYFIIQHIDNY
jgi:hypothetical protein